MIKEKLNNLKVITPDEVLDKFLKWLDKKKKMAFFITIIVGIITHITMITEMIMSQDGLWNSISYSRAGLWETTLGRWGIELITRVTSFIAIPSITTIFNIILMAITAVFLVDLFNLKSKISIFFTSIALVLTPTFTVTLLYVYTSFAYCANMLIATLVVWFIYKFPYKKWGIVLSSICFMMVLSIYQSYVGVTVGLCVMVSVLHLIKGEKSIKEIFINILKTVISVIAGGIIYYIITMILLKVSGVEFAAYKGANNISIMDIILNLKTTIIQAYKDFLFFFLGDSIVYNSNYRREVLYGIFFLMFGISCLISIFSIKSENKKERVFRIVISILFLALLPLALNIIDVIACSTTIYALTGTQLILMIPFAFAIFELIEKFIILKWIGVLFCVLIMLTYYIATNTSYSALKLTYNQAYSTTVRIMDRIENTTGYTKDAEILFGGIVGNNNYPRTSSLYNYTIGSIVNNTTFHGTYAGQIGTWMSFLKVFLGVDFVPCSENTYYTIVNSQEYKDMDVFPATNSVKVLNGIVVVKLSENPPLPY